MSLINRSNNYVWHRVGLYLTATVLAVIFGLIAITNNPILIGIALGMLFGLFLIARPRITIWIVLIFGLCTPAILDILGHGLSRIQWSVSMLAIALWLPGFFHMFSFNPKSKKIIPLFIWVAILFTVVAVVSTLSQLNSLGELIAGFKRYFQSYGLMLAIAAIPWIRADMDRWLKAMLAIALLQLPFSLFERLILVPIRGGIDLLGAETTDVVAGTMGANIHGGSPNTVMVFFVILAFVFVVSRWKEKLISTSKMCVLSVALLSPLALGETKVVILLLPLVSCLLFMKDILRNPSKYIPILGFLILISFGFAYIYVDLMLDSTFGDAYRGILKYNLEEDVGYGSLILNRSTSITFWAALHGWSDPISLLFGHGLGSSYGSSFDAGHIARIYPNYGINLTTVSTLLWDLGLTGFFLYLSILAIAWWQLGFVEINTINPKARADSLSVRIGIVLTTIYLIYSDSQVNLIAHEIIIAFLLGYGAFLYREFKESAK